MVSGKNDGNTPLTANVAKATLTVVKEQSGGSVGDAVYSFTLWNALLLEQGICDADL